MGALHAFAAAGTETDLDVELCHDRRDVGLKLLESLCLANPNMTVRTHSGRYVDRAVHVIRSRSVSWLVTGFSSRFLFGRRGVPAVLPGIRGFGFLRLFRTPKRSGLAFGLSILRVELFLEFLQLFAQGSHLFAQGSKLRFQLAALRALPALSRRSIDGPPFTRFEPMREYLFSTR